MPKPTPHAGETPQEEDTARYESHIETAMRLARGIIAERRRPNQVERLAVDMVRQLERAVQTRDEQIAQLQQQVKNYQDAPITTTWRGHLGPLREDLEQALAREQALREALENTLAFLKWIEWSDTSSEDSACDLKHEIEAALASSTKKET